MKRFIPFLLTTLRLFLGPVALAAAGLGWPRALFLPLSSANVEICAILGLSKRPRWMCFRFLPCGSNTLRG